MSIGTLPTQQMNKRLFASWILVGGRLQDDNRLVSRTSAHPRLQSLSSEHCPWAMCWEFVGMM